MSGNFYLVNHSNSALCMSPIPPQPLVGFENFVPFFRIIDRKRHENALH